jgi:hypothetical protein
VGAQSCGRFSDLGMQVLVLMASRVGGVVDGFAGAEQSVVLGADWFSWMGSWAGGISETCSREILGGSLKTSL